jgi:SAM-dependent methyltransferase
VVSLPLSCYACVIGQRGRLRRPAQPGLQLPVYYTTSGELLNMSKKRRRKRSHALPVRVTARSDSSIALEVDGVVQSVSIPSPDDNPIDVSSSDTARNLLSSSEPEPGPDSGYWGLLLPPECPRCALLLGLGGGTVAHLLARRCPGVEITGIEHDPEVLAVGRSRFGLESLPQLLIVEADAFAWVSQQSQQHQGADTGYDLICLDLFNAGRLADGALSKTFLRQISQLISPAGRLTVNLMMTARTPDQLRRLEQVFVLIWKRRLRGNLVVHAQLPASTTPDISPNFPVVEPTDGMVEGK